MSLAQMESRSVPPQDDSSKNGVMVIGLPMSRTASLDSTLISPDVIPDPSYFLEKGVDAFGRALNPVVSAVHNDPKNDVKFRVRRKIDKQKPTKHRRTITTEDVPVSDPQDREQFPEAFTSRLLLQHMRKNAPFYTDFLSLRGSTNELRTPIDLVLWRIPRMRIPSLTSQAVVHTLFHMEGFLDLVTDGLESSEKFSLASDVKGGMSELRDIRNSADHARRLSLELSQ
jgi:hypothetical protein